MGRPVLELEQLRLRYPGSESWTLDGLNLSLEPGETLALVGSSGCGKSTVARAVMQLLPQGTVCEGRLALTGQDPRQLRRPQLRQLRGKAVGLVFQDPMTRMNPLMSVGGHLIDTLRAHRPQTSAAAHQNGPENSWSGWALGPTASAPTPMSSAVACDSAWPLPWRLPWNRRC